MLKGTRTAVITFCSILILGTVLITESCGTPYGVYHTVKKGETLYRISRTYGVKMEDIILANRLTDPGDIKEGQVIFIPGAREVKEVKPYHSAENVQSSGSHRTAYVKKSWNNSLRGNRHSGSTSSSFSKKKSQVKFIWPVIGTLTSKFGMRNGSPHDGIDIAAPEGTPVRAAADGRVVYSGNELRGYGNLIIIKHEGRFFTVYAHNQINLVKEGDFVKQGEIIARVGRTGRITGPHLHFEIRRGKVPVNPLLYLPKR